MDSPDNSLPSLIVTGAAAAASLLVLVRLFDKYIGGRPLLPYEPRRPVPWNFLAPLVMLGPAAWNMAIVLLADSPARPAPESLAVTATASATALTGSPAVQAAATVLAGASMELVSVQREAAAFMPMVWMGAAASLLFTAICFALLVGGFGASWKDLGLPTDWRQLRGDAGLGAVAWAASVAPVFGLMLVLNMLVEPTEVHPLLEHYMASPSWAMMAAAAMAAVVAAPIAEETSFRLVLQGWMERVEAFRRAPLQTMDASPADATAGADDGRFYRPGWTPILLSSVLFGLAHFGHGVAPIPLVFLGGVLGYLYQRTHRIVPGVVCHMLFNAFTLVLLWLDSGP